MKSYFVAALSFVGVLGSAAGAMAINNDTLSHGGTDLTAASSATLVKTATVKDDAIVDPATGLPVSLPSATTAPGAGADSNAAPALPPALTLPASVIAGTSGGSGGSGAHNSNSTSASKAHPISKPGSAGSSSASSGSGGSSGVSATTGGSSAVPGPAAGSGSGNKGSKATNREREHEGEGWKKRNKSTATPAPEPAQYEDDQESEGDD